MGGQWALGSDEKSTAAFSLRRARARGARSGSCRPPPGYRATAGAATSERRVPSRGRGGGGRSAPCAAPSAATDAFADEPLRSPWTRSSLAQREASVAPRIPRPPTERTGPARAPRSAARIPPSKIWNRWRGAALTRTSFGGSFCVPRPEHGENDDAPPARPPSASGARAGASPRPVDPTFTKDVKVGKRAADAREDLERLGQWGSGAVATPWRSR